MKIRSSNFLHLPVFFLAAALALTGCGASSEKSVTVAETAAAAAPAAGSPSPEGALEENGSNDFGTAADTSAESEIPAPNESSQTTPVQTGRKLIRTVWLDMETTDFDSSLQSVHEKISALEGYTEQSEITGSRLNYAGEPILRHASMTVRIPTKHLEAFLQAAQASGNIVSQSETTEDVTCLLYTSPSPRDRQKSVIALEERLSEIRYELESLEARLRLYNNQVEYSTVHLTLYEADESRLTPSKPLTAAQRISRDFQNNLASMGQLLLNLLISILTLAPFWVPAVLLILLLIWLLRRKVGNAKCFFRKKKKSTPQEGESNS